MIKFDEKMKRQLLLGTVFGIALLIIGIVGTWILVSDDKRQETRETSGQPEKLKEEDSGQDGRVASAKETGGIDRTGEAFTTKGLGDTGSMEDTYVDEEQGDLGNRDKEEVAEETLSENKAKTFLEESPKGNWTVYYEKEEAYGFLIRFENNHSKEVYYDWSRTIEELLWNEEETKVAIAYRSDSNRYDFKIIELKPDSYFSYGKSFFYSGLFYNGIAWSMEIYNKPLAWENGDCLKAEFQCYDLKGELYQGTYTIDTRDDKITDYHFTRYPQEPLRLEGKLGDVIASSWDLYEKQEYPLLAETEDKRVRLYDIKEGDWGNLLIQSGELIQMLPWGALSPHYILPRIYEADLDKDGTKEIICILHTGTGTGVSIDEVHILEPGKDGYYVDMMFEPEDYIAQIEELVKGDYDSKNQQIILKVNNTSTRLPDEMKEYTFEKLCFGNFIGYDYEEKTNTLRMQIGAECIYKELVPPQYLAEIEAKIIYKEESFRIQNPVLMDGVE